MVTGKGVKKYIKFSKIIKNMNSIKFWFFKDSINKKVFSVNWITFEYSKIKNTEKETSIKKNIKGIIFLNFI